MISSWDLSLELEGSRCRLQFLLKQGTDNRYCNKHCKAGHTMCAIQVHLLQQIQMTSTTMLGLSDSRAQKILRTS